MNTVTSGTLRVSDLTLPRGSAGGGSVMIHNYTLQVKGTGMMSEITHQLELGCHNGNYCTYIFIV